MKKKNNLLKNIKHVLNIKRTITKQKNYLQKRKLLIMLVYILYCNVCNFEILLIKNKKHIYIHIYKNIYFIILNTVFDFKFVVFCFILIKLSLFFLKLYNYIFLYFYILTNNIKQVNYV